MSKVEVGDSVEVGDRAATVNRILTRKKGHLACEVELEEGGPALLWRDTPEWGERVRGILDRKPVAALPEIVTSSFSEDRAKLLVEGIPEGAAPFRNDVWRAFDPTIAVSALEEIGEMLATIHARGATLYGLKRRDLYLHPETGHLHLAAMPRLRMEETLSVESVWRDLRLIGELLYENFMEVDYPGGHQMAEMLQDRTAIAETEMYFPGLPQVLAGCVSPYGDLAYVDAEEVLEGLEQIRIELQQPLQFEIGATSTVGNYIFRKNNQDSCGHLAFQSICGSHKASIGFFCVADGIGGIQDGERASRLAVDTACQAFARAWAHYGAETIKRRPVEFARLIAKIVGQRLALEGEFHPDNNRGGTTFSGLLVIDDRAAVCHVGDSRIVLVRDDEQIHLTHDHTLANILIALGELNEEEAESNELSQRTISRFLSTSAEVETDRIDGFGPQAREALGEEIDAHGMEVQRGDLFLLSSDGAHGEADEETLERLMEEFDDPQELCDAIVDIALQNIGRDNATMLALRIV